VRELLVAHDHGKRPYDPGRDFDLAIGSAFVEHLEQAFEANGCASLRRCERVLMCHAFPGQRPVGRGRLTLLFFVRNR
jgi:hypothetical protein